MSDIFAAQFTAIANAVLAVFAIATAIIAYLAFRKQSKEVSDQAEMLRIQGDELRQVSADREREAQDRRRAQAVQVYMWLTPGEGHEPAEVFAHVRNTSHQPIYKVEIQWWPEPDGQLDESERPAAAQLTDHLMPGEELRGSSGDLGPYAMCCTVFRDRAGVRWRTHPDGRLHQAPEPWEMVAASLRADGASA